MARGQRRHHDQLISPDGDGAELTVRVTPRARRHELAGIVEGPDGVRALGALRIIGGQKSRLKRVRIAGVGPAQLAGRLSLTEGQGHTYVPSTPKRRS